jgi:hypothetical protein
MTADGEFRKHKAPKFGATNERPPELVVGGTFAKKVASSKDAQVAKERERVMEACAHARDRTPSRTKSRPLSTRPGPLFARRCLAPPCACRCQGQGCAAWRGRRRRRRPDGSILGAVRARLRSTLSRNSLGLVPSCVRSQSPRGAGRLSLLGECVCVKLTSKPKS